MNNVVIFPLVAVALFRVGKGMNPMKKRAEKEKAAAPPPHPPAEVVLLQEIRDALRARS